MTDATPKPTVRAHRLTELRQAKQATPSRRQEMLVRADELRSGDFVFDAHGDTHTLSVVRPIANGTRISTKRVDHKHTEHWRPDDVLAIIRTIKEDDNVNTYHSADPDQGTRLSYRLAGQASIAPDAGRIVVTKGGHGYYVDLSPADRRFLAMDLVSDQYDASEEFDGSIKLTPRSPAVKEGEFYRVKSEEGMMPAFQGNPIVKVIREVRPGEWNFLVTTADGVTSPWSKNSMDLLEGPLEVEATTVVAWKVKD